MIFGFPTSSSSNTIFRLVTNSSQAQAFDFSWRAKLEHALLNKARLVYSPTNRAHKEDFSHSSQKSNNEIRQLFSPSLGTHLLTHQSTSNNTHLPHSLSLSVCHSYQPLGLSSFLVQQIRINLNSSLSILLSFLSFQMMCVHQLSKHRTTKYKKKKSTNTYTLAETTTILSSQNPQIFSLNTRPQQCNLLPTHTKPKSKKPTKPLNERERVPIWENPHRREREMVVVWEERNGNWYVGLG